MPNINANQSSDSLPLLCFASEDFCFSAWANLPVTPHLQQGYYPWQRYVRSSAYSGSSALPRRACGWATRGCTPRLSFKAAALNGDEARPPCAFLSFPRARKCLRRLKWSRRRLGSSEEVNRLSTCRRLCPPEGCQEYGQVYLRGEKWPVEQSWARCRAVRFHLLSEDNKLHLISGTEIDVRAETWAQPICQTYVSLLRESAST